MKVTTALFSLFTLVLGCTSLGSTIKQGEVPSGLLAQGMILQYSSNGVPIPVWVIGKVSIGLNHSGMSGCSKIEINYGDDTNFRTKWECVAEGVLYSYENDKWLPSRPADENMYLEKQNSSGKIISSYETKTFSRMVVGPLNIKVLSTSIYNYKPDGTVENRLREMFSIGLGTAVEGVFEVPDAAVEGGWRIVNEFKLIAISDGR